MTRPQPLILIGLDGGNSLAFLAAVGTLRTLTLAWPRDDVSLSWSREGGIFRPCLHARRELDAASVVEALHAQLRTMTGHKALSLGDNLNVAPSVFRDYAMGAVAEAHQATDKLHGRVWADFAAAFACEATTNSRTKGVTIQDTALRTMSGAGHQHFLKFMRDLVAATEPAHLQKALFDDWRYDDEGRGLFMRWDPDDDRRYALRWNDPSSDPSRTVRGANRLAVEALPVFSSIPDNSRLETIGFTNRGRTGVFWSWPIWNARLSMSACQSLLSSTAIHQQPAESASLIPIGVEAIYRCERITIGKFRNFTPAEQV